MLPTLMLGAKRNRSCILYHTEGCQCAAGKE
nr:MAG TPA: hypothetical protein [Caudoviricetes sp.]